MKKFQYLILPAIFLLVFIIFTVMVKTIDVQYLLNNSYIGFYTMNHAINTWVGEYGKMDFAKTLSDVLMYASFVFVFGYMVAFVVQWIKTKSLKLVDQRYYLILGTFVLTVLIYVIFEIVKVNYSPLYDGKLKASYPSTHVLVTSIFFITSTLVAIDMLQIKKNYLRIILYALLAFLGLLFGFIRLLSGRHWFSDIIASYLLVGVVLSLFIPAYYVIMDRKKEELNW